MRLSVSQIAWKPEDNEAVGFILQKHGIEWIDIAPSMQWSQPDAVSEEEIRKFSAFWNGFGIQFWGMQSVLYGQKEKIIFGSTDQREKTKKYLKRVIDLAARLGVKRIVFGSPENRKVGDLELTTALAIAAEFFYELAEYCRPNDIVFCLEHNPQKYGCDFITTPEEALSLVMEVNHPNLKINFDLGGAVLSDFDFVSQFEKILPWIGYVHLSEPHLKSLNNRPTHAHFGKILKDVGYTEMLGIEMRKDANKRIELQLLETLELVKTYYRL